MQLENSRREPQGKLSPVFQPLTPTERGVVRTRQAGLDHPPDEYRSPKKVWFDVNEEARKRFP